MTPEHGYRRKLIEVDLPLDAINDKAASEPTTSPGHPWRLHVWWARRRQVACRAVTFASLVDDPSSCPEFRTEEAQRAERRRLHDLIERLVDWENSGDEGLVNEARFEIARSVARSRNDLSPSKDDPAAVLRYLNDKAPSIHDPFCGGGSIPLEAQRLGLRAVGSDLNPIAVLITKALIELPTKFADQPPANADADPLGMTAGRGTSTKAVPWQGAAGLADDIRYYGRWVGTLARKRIGHLYPKARLSDGREATVFAWLWARTVTCPNPACGLPTPLSPTFQISKRVGSEHWSRPVFDRNAKQVSFAVQDHDQGVLSGGARRGGGFVCAACGGAIAIEYVREQGRQNGLPERMSAIVAEGSRGRSFLSPTEEHVQAATVANPNWRPFGRLPEKALGFRVHVTASLNGSISSRTDNWWPTPRSPTCWLRPTRLFLRPAVPATQTPYAPTWPLP